MKNTLEINFMTSEKFDGDLPMNVAGLQAPQSKTRRDSMAPKIVVCPPMEDLSEPNSLRSDAIGGRLLKVLTSRLSRRTADSDSEASSSSSDSGDTGRADDHSSSSVSESGSDGSDRRRRHRSTVSLRRVFQSLSLSSRSQSCSPTERSRPSKKQQQPKRILRSPVTYTYVRGLSGLPTQRVPRHRVCCLNR